MIVIKFIYHIFRNIFDTFLACIISFQKGTGPNDLYANCSELFITHTFGGGTRTFENNYLKNTKNIFIMRNVRGFKTKYITVNKYGEKKHYVFNVKKLDYLFQNLRPSKITVSSIIPYTNCKRMLESIIEYKNKTNASVCYMIHDFHCICPNFTLLAKDFSCNLDCSTHKCKINADIIEWRLIWKNFFSEIDEIRVFSESSKDMILQAYPDLHTDKFNIQPHDLSYCHFKPYKIRTEEPARIAIVGSCNTVAKGNKIVNDLVTYYDKKEIVLFGKIPLNGKARRNKVVLNFGPYKNDELPYLMEKYNINTVIFPSVCAETFSYTVSELIMFGINIICFDIGAQAEKVRNYEQGFIAPEISANAVITILENIV
ncbi:glycosyltransferase [Treponema brennaborense]|uniref:Glycosyl transferase group 1 n=1 Tax=Treponema brennaborense (strain DSM 12168 / CIP 105900 / DD5/3) TaxID=906968 RepID=F4LNN1_TREBD|nr:glycosyltransferase [Treponema brennaborense]AEE15885.1 hypothetical protein Trebr_0441 [Treponema brennaborense DSM 12168]